MSNVSDNVLERFATRLLDASEATTSLDVVGARGGFTSALLAALASRGGPPLAIVVADEAQAAALQDGLNLFIDRAGHFPAASTLPRLDHSPFSGMSPSRLTVMDRVCALFRHVHQLDLDALIISAPALLDRVVPSAALEQHATSAVEGQSLDLERLVGFLTVAGYHRVSSVEDPGSFAVRGGIVDVYAPLYPEPVRIDLWGDEIEAIRFFDPSTQRTTARVKSVMLCPSRDIMLTHGVRRRAKERLLDLADARDVPTSRARALVDDIGRGVLGVGAEELLPAFHDELETLFDVLDDRRWLIVDRAACVRAMEDRHAEVVMRAAQRVDDSGTLAFDVHDLYLPAERVVSLLDEQARVSFEPFETPGRDTLVVDVADNGDIRHAIAETTKRGDDEVLAPLASRIHHWRREGLVVAACAATRGGVTRLQALLARYGVSVEHHDDGFRIDRVSSLRDTSTDLHLFEGALGDGFRSHDLCLVLLNESEILGKPPRRRVRRRRVAPEQAIAGWQDLRVDDLVVHLQHGIGKYQGLVKTDVNGMESDFVLLHYAKGDKLFVPVDKLHLVSKHVSSGDGSDKLDKLGGASWQRTTKRVKKAVRNIADKLLRLYAQREAKRGYAFSPPDETFRRFEASFPFEETPDQDAAITAALDDMQKERPMDRLVCGDVGFGKTEVAVRAAMKAVLDGKQVVVLVPTQVLAEQHRVTFERRFEGFPVRISTLSRSVSSLEQKNVLDHLKRGLIDIAIGTHRLLSKDIQFADLGLIVVDEEHRFGVAQKEGLKRSRPTVDVLTLTATPIPRTLHLSMVGLRDISLIRTPPVDRLPIKTFVTQPTEHVIAEAIGRELARGGQVFYVHNRVADIHRHAELVQRLVPNARVAVGHGQMHPTRLEEAMLRFVSGEANVLVATTIIESGIDIPTANTMLINRADRFGLAQLYQLRGRVGRSSERAYCYLMIPSPKNLAGDAKERIAAIQRFSELGSGFSIATHDLDIRGAGEILGAEQSGSIDAVGYEAYTEMLRDAIEDLRASQDGETPPSRVETELKIPIEGRIPEDYLEDTTLRLRLYRELASARTVPALYEVLSSAVDRYGDAPQPLSDLVQLMAVKIDARGMGIDQVTFNRRLLSLRLTELGPIPLDAVLAFVSRTGSGWRLTPTHRLQRDMDEASFAQGLEVVRESLKEIRTFVSERASSL